VEISYNYYCITYLPIFFKGNGISLSIRRLILKYSFCNSTFDKHMVQEIYNIEKFIQKQSANGDILNPLFGLKYFYRITSQDNSFHIHVKVQNLVNLLYTCTDNIINCRVLIFTDFVVHLNHKNKNPTKYNFPIDCCLYVVFETMNSRTDGSMHFVETT
jgi:hypothetical protein